MKRCIWLLTSACLFAMPACADIDFILLNSMFVASMTPALAATGDHVAMTSDDFGVRVYHVGLDGAAELEWEIECPPVRQLGICRGYLMISYDDMQGRLGLMACDLTNHAVITDLDMSEEVSLMWMATHDDRLYLGSFMNGLTILTVDADGGIAMVAQDENQWFPDATVACNARYLSVVESFNTRVLLDITNPQAIQQVTGFSAFEELTQVGFTEDCLIEAGWDDSPFYNGVRVLQPGEEGFTVLSQRWGGSIVEGHLRTQGDLVVVQDRPWPNFTGLLRCYQLSGQGQLSPVAEVGATTIDDYALTDHWLFVRDWSHHRLYIYLIFTAPHLECQLLPNHDLGLSWNAVPGATSYRVYARDEVLGVRRLLEQTEATETVVDPQADGRFFDVTAVR